jgi:ribonuclease III
MTLEKKLNYTFKNKENLKLALTHPSFLGNQSLSVPKTLLSNQRLEFLGDSILSLVLTTYLMDKYPVAGEGELTQVRSLFVCGKTLTEIGRKLGIQDFLFVDRNYTVSDSDVADAVEAIVAAVYVDGGIIAAQIFVHHLFAEYIQNGTVPEAFVDYKSNFQKLVHSKFRQVEPEYETMEIKKGKIFSCKLKVKGLTIAVGMGTSKKRAEVNAAEIGCQDWLEMSKDMR